VALGAAQEPALKSLANVLSPFLTSARTNPESAARQCLARLKARGDIAADTTWMLSPAGRERALSTLGVQALPKRASWLWVYGLLAARGYDADPAPVTIRRIAEADNLRRPCSRSTMGLRAYRR